jgi:DNA-binding MarR family transcriptional regulator
MKGLLISGARPVYRNATFFNRGSGMADETGGLTDADYAALADFRRALRRFHAFSETSAMRAGLTAQQHQALLAIRGAPSPDAVTVGYIAQRLILKPHSASGLIDRLEALELVRRETAPEDRRRALLRLTGKATALLETLSASHKDEIRRLQPLLADLLARLT